MRAKKRLLIRGFLAAVVLVPWIFRAQLVLACTPLLVVKGETGGQWLRDTLILCGSSSIAPIIGTLRHESPWQRNYCYLPAVLEHFGEPAHQQLLLAIDSETNKHSRWHLISALQSAFKDFSRFDRCISDPDYSTSSYAIVHMSGTIHLAFPEAPPLGSRGSESPFITINPDFLVWWQAHQSK
jgi:hypothetical protein